jgi:hypothetical protein
LGGNPSHHFGSNTFHLEVEDLLAGGEANLTFGQGKHVIEYLTQSEKQEGWMKGQNLSAHSGIGHVTPYVDEIFKIGLAELTNKFMEKANKYKTSNKDKYNLFISTVFTLLGLK